MNDLITQARAVEARLRDAISHPMLMINSVETITALCTTLEAAQTENKLLHERHHFDNVAYTEAQKDAERYRWLRENLGVKVSHWFCTERMEALDAEIDAEIKAQGEKK